VRGFGHGEMEVGINPMPRFEIDAHATQKRHFRVWALRKSITKEVVPQIKVGLNQYVGLAQSHKGHDMNDPRGGHVVLF
jgi:hypothetical protein